MTGQPDWWEGFFSGLWLEVQRQFKSEEQTQAEADFIEKALALAPGAHVLDAPCGEGRIALTLAARGYQVTGVDITEPLLDDARRQAATRGLDVTWERRDMRDLPWEGAFDAVLCFWGSFGYFDDAGNIEHVQAVARALKPGGRFVIDTHVAESLFRVFTSRGWNPVGDILLLEERRYDHVRSRTEVEWTFVREGVIQRQSSSIRVYTYNELCRLLESAGFGAFAGYGSLDVEPFALRSPRLYLVATKQAG